MWTCESCRQTFRDSQMPGITNSGAGKSQCMKCYNQGIPVDLSADQPVERCEHGSLECQTCDSIAKPGRFYVVDKRNGTRHQVKEWQKDHVLVYDDITGVPMKIPREFCLECA